VRLPPLVLRGWPAVFAAGPNEIEVAELAKKNRSSLRAVEIQKKDQRCWPVSYRWVAVGTLVAYSAIGAKQVANAQVLPVSAGPPGSAPGQGTRPVRRFNIPAEPLEEALSAFEATSGVSVSVPEEGMRAIRSAGVAGSYTPEQAWTSCWRKRGLRGDSLQPQPRNFSWRRSLRWWKLTRARTRLPRA